MHGKSRGDGANSAGRIVDGDATGAFARDVTIKEMAQRFRSEFVTGRFDGVGDVIRDDGRAAGLLVPQIPAFGTDLKKGIAEGYAGDADGQRQDKIQSPSHFRSS